MTTRQLLTERDVDGRRFRHAYYRAWRRHGAPPMTAMRLAWGPRVFNARDTEMLAWRESLGDVMADVFYDKTLWTDRGPTCSA